MQQTLKMHPQPGRYTLQWQIFKMPEIVAKSVAKNAPLFRISAGAGGVLAFSAKRKTL
jgi:hypothetical protein